jgi:hypothetical protein
LSETVLTRLLNSYHREGQIADVSVGQTFLSAGFTWPTGMSAPR